MRRFSHLLYDIIHLQISKDLGFEAAWMKVHSTHLNRFIGGDEREHEVETRAAGGGQESPSSASTHTVRYIVMINHSIQLYFIHLKIFYYE